MTQGMGTGNKMIFDSDDIYFECSVGHKSKKYELIIGSSAMGGTTYHCPSCYAIWLRNNISQAKPSEKI